MRHRPPGKTAERIFRRTAAPDLREPHDGAQAEHVGGEDGRRVRVLHLDHHVLPRVQLGDVGLARRRRADCLWVEVSKQLADWPKVLLDHLPYCRKVLARNVALQLFELRAIRVRHEWTRRCRLPKLDVQASQ